MSIAITSLLSTALACALDRRALVKALTRLKHALVRRPPLPVLEAVLIESQDERLNLTVTDLSVFVRVVVPATVTTSGALLVPLRRLLEATRSGPSRIQLAGESVVAGTVTHRLATLTPDSFPSVPEPGGEVLAAWMRPTLARMLRQTTYALSEDEARPHLCGLFVERREGSLACVATDGHRMAVARVPDEGPAFHTLLNPATVRELTRMVAESGGIVRLRRDGERAWFTSGEEWIAGRVVDAVFPSYEQVLPTEREGSITMPTGDLRAALHAMAPRGTPVLKLVPERDAARVQLLVEDDDNITEGEVLASFAGEVPAAIGFNACYLREAVDALTEDDATVTIQVSGEIDPVRIDSAHGTTAVVMPMKL